MTQETEEYRPFRDMNLSNARSENESYEDYRKRLKQNKHILKVYDTVGLDVFKEMFPAGVGEALKNSVVEAEKVNTETLGEAK